MKKINVKKSEPVHGVTIAVALVRTALFILVWGAAIKL